jgi:hypothetical protein
LGRVLGAQHPSHHERFASWRKRAALAAYFVNPYFWGARRCLGRHPHYGRAGSRPGEWVVATGKNLTTIYAPHGHGDHFFGTSTVLDRFPGVRFVARPDVIKVMRQQASPESLATFWNPRFPGQISSHLAIAEELAGNVINLEGHDLVSVPLGFTDTANTTCLHVPAIGMNSAKGNSKSLRPMVVSLLWLTGTSKRLMCHITRSSPTAESQCTSGTAGRLGNSP